jgi:hypothetical protein
LVICACAALGNQQKYRKLLKRECSLSENIILWDETYRNIQPYPLAQLERVAGTWWAHAGTVEYRRKVEQNVGCPQEYPLRRHCNEKSLLSLDHMFTLIISISTRTDKIYLSLCTHTATTYTFIVACPFYWYLFSVFFIYMLGYIIINHNILNHQYSCSINLSLYYYYWI